MAVIKNYKTGHWEVRTYYKNQDGERKQKTKRGFLKKQNAVEWEREFKLKESRKLAMSFATFAEIYLEEIRPRLKESTYITKSNLIRSKIVPYFEGKAISDIRNQDIVLWQNRMMTCSGNRGKGFSPGYLRAMQNQLSAIFNYAVNIYGLQGNPVHRAGKMGKVKSAEMLFWIKEEYFCFISKVHGAECRFAFELLYWTGMRIGELLALTFDDFNFGDNTICINKSLQRIHGEDIVTSPKTEKSDRVIILPEFLAEEVKGHIEAKRLGKGERILTISRSSLRREMQRAADEAGVKRIRIHDLRHSHVSLLIAMGFSALEIGERVGHEAVSITYRYAHLFPSVQRKMAERLNEAGKGMTTK